MHKRVNKQKTSDYTLYVCLTGTTIHAGVHWEY